MKREFVLLKLLLLLLIFPVQGWDWDTHRWFAERLCNDFSCGCLQEIKDGSIAPDRDFRDTGLHHCYDPLSCTESNYWDCPTARKCPAMDKASEWLEKAKTMSGCGKWYAIGVASHYWLDAKCFWHQVQNEDYNACHKPFEDKVGDRFYKKQTGWTVCQCDVCVSYSDFEQWYAEFRGIVAEALKAPAITPTPTPSTPVKTTPAPVITTTPDTTPVSTTPVYNQTPSMTTPVKTTPTPVVTPKTTPVPAITPKKIPGFEIAPAILAVAILLWRKRSG